MQLQALLVTGDFEDLEDLNQRGGQRCSTTQHGGILSWTCFSQEKKAGLLEELEVRFGCCVIEVKGQKTLREVSKTNCSSGEQRERMTISNLLAVLFLMQPRMSLGFLAAQVQSKEKKRLWGDLITAFPYLLGCHNQNASMLFTVVHDGRMKANGHQLKQIMKNFKKNC